MKNTLLNFLKSKNTFDKGEQFEQWIRDEIFTKQHFRILEKSHNYQTNKDDYIEATMNPDFKLQHIKTKFTFWIECKYRFQYDQKFMIDAVSKNQLYRHKKIKEPVFFLIGIGDKPKKIDELYLIPILKMYPKIYPSYAENFEIPINQITDTRLLTKP